ncbi:MAG: alpha/beta hydrolase family protein [Fimbriimonadales bacterium]
MKRWIVQLSAGEIPILADEETRETVVILAHGAGSHMEHKTLEWLTGLVRESGASIVRFNFLYRVLGKSMPDRMPVLMETYRAVIGSVRQRLAPKRLTIGGHSLGGRVASMIEAEGQTADGLLLFGYPLHPPGQPEKLRDAHLTAIQTPTLQISGTRDDFCTVKTMQAVMSNLDPNTWSLKWIEAADHSYTVNRASGRSRNDVDADIRDALGLWLLCTSD